MAYKYPTKLWIPAQAMEAANAAQVVSIMSHIDLDALLEEIGFQVHLPDNVRMVSLKVTLIYLALAAHAGGDDGIDISCNGATDGEAYNTNSDCLTGVANGVKVANVIYHEDITAAFSAFAAEDTIGVFITPNDSAGTVIDIGILGCLFEWS